MTATLAWALRIALGAVLGAAGVLKLRDPSQFATEIANYQLLPALAPLLAASIPAAEVVLAVALVVAPVGWRRAAALAAAALLGVFTVAVAQVLARDINVDCGCFGGGTGPVTGLTLVRDLVLLGAAGALAWLSPAPSRR